MVSRIFCSFSLSSLLVSLSLSISFPAASGDEIQALRDAFSDCVRQPGRSRPTRRYVYRIPGISDPETDRLQLELALNLALAREATEIVRVEVVSDTVFAFDFRFFRSDADEAAAIWDSLAARDSVFHLPGSGESIAVVGGQLSEAVAVDVSGDLEPKRLDVMLSELTGGSAPILELRFVLEELLERSYYRFRGIAAGDDLFELLAERGYYHSVGKDVVGLRANLVLPSRITGDERIVLAIFGGAGPTPALVTYDLADGRDLPAEKFSRNLERFAEIEDGKEIFTPLRNGLLEFWLTDGENKIVDEAPPDLAADSTKPDGHDKRLRPALSCLACHSREESGLYLPLENGFAELPELAESGSDVGRIFGRKLDEPDGVLGRARRDLALALAPLLGGKSVDDVFGALSTRLRSYRYDLVSPEQASKELGFSVAALQLSPDEPVDPELFRLISGRSISRESFDAVRATLSALLRQQERGNDDQDRAASASASDPDGES